jgi:hypothetical protein
MSTSEKAIFCIGLVVIAVIIGLEIHGGLYG